MIKKMFYFALLTPAVLFAADLSLAERFADYPDVVGTVFDVPITRQEMIDYYAARPNMVPDWLEPPFSDSQKENLARTFIDMREKAVAAEKNGILPTRERAEAYLRREIAKLNEDERENLATALKAKKRTMEEYIAESAADPDFQRRAVEDDLMTFLNKKLEVTDQEIDEYFEKHKYSYNYDPNEYICYITYDENGKIVGGDDKKNTLHLRAGIPQSVLAVADKLKEGEISGLLEAKGKKFSIKKLPLPDPTIENRKKQIKNAIESEQAMDALGELHRLSGITYNIPLAGIGDFL